MNFSTTSSTSVSASYSDSFTSLVYPPDDSLVTEGTYASVYPYYSGRVTGYDTFSESISVPDLELPVTEVIFVASYLTIL